LQADKLIYWDSCAFIHLLNQTEEYFAVLDDIKSRARKGECKIITSTVSLAEVCKIPGTGTLPIEQTNKILAFMQSEYIELWSADRYVCEEAHHIIRLHDLLPMDAIHIATALLAKPEVLITTDSKKHRRKGLLSLDGAIGNPPLSIKKPSLGLVLPLWDSAAKINEKPKTEDDTKETKQ
jgi:predicted nucleic acid-binding protein